MIHVPRKTCATIMAIACLHFGSVHADAQGTRQQPAQFQERAKLHAETYFPTFLTFQQLVDTLTLAQCLGAVDGKQLGDLYLEQQSSFDRWSKRIQPEFMQTVIRSVSAMGGLDAQASQMVLKTWRDEQVIEKTLFDRILSSAPGEMRRRVELAWELRHASFMGERTNRVATSVRGAGRMGQVDLLECYMLCASIDLEDKENIAWALAYERRRTQLLQELATAALAAHARTRVAARLSKEWVEARQRTNPDGNFDPRLGIAVTTALQIAPMICILDEISTLQQESLEALAGPLDPISTWCLYAEAAAASLERGRQSRFRLRLRETYESLDASTPEGAARRAEIETFMETDTEKLRTWLELNTSQLDRQCVILGPMIDIQTVNVEEVAQMIESEGEMFTHGTTPQMLLHQRYLALKAYVDGIDPPAPSTP